MRFPFPRLFSCHHLSTFSLGVTLTGGGREEERDRVLYLSFQKEMEEWGRKRRGEIQWYIIHHPKLAHKIIRLISLKFSLQTISLSETNSDTPNCLEVNISSCQISSMQFFFLIYIFTFVRSSKNQRKSYFRQWTWAVMPKQNFRNLRIDGITKDNLFHGVLSPASRFLFYWHNFSRFPFPHKCIWFVLF